MDKLREAGLSVSPGASYYAVLQQGQQIGFASSTVDTTDGGISVHDYLVADLPIGGELHRATARTEVELTRALRVSQFKMQVDAGLVPIDATGQVLGDTLLIVIVRSATTPADTHRVRLDGPVLLPTLVPLAVALGDRPKRGARITLPVFDPIALAPTRHARDDRGGERVRVPDSSVFDREDVALDWCARPDTVRAWRIATDSATGASGFRGWVDAAGADRARDAATRHDARAPAVRGGVRELEGRRGKRGARGAGRPRHLRDDGDRGEQAAARERRRRCASGSRAPTSPAST